MNPIKEFKAVWVAVIHRHILVQTIAQNNILRDALHDVVDAGVRSLSPSHPGGPAARCQSCVVRSDHVSTIKHSSNCPIGAAMRGIDEAAKKT